MKKPYKRWTRDLLPQDKGSFWAVDIEAGFTPEELIEILEMGSVEHAQGYFEGDKGEPRYEYMTLPQSTCLQIAASQKKKEKEQK